MLVFKVGGIVVAVVIGIVVGMYSISDPTAITVYGQLGLLEPESEPDPTTHNEVWCELVQGGQWFTLDGEGHCLTN
jgi:hypothetical protein